MGNSPLYVHTPVEDIRNRLSDEEIDRLAILFFEFRWFYIFLSGITSYYVDYLVQEMILWIWNPS